MDTYNVIGVMSGTSLDGLDIALCKFEISENYLWSYKIITAETISFKSTLKKRLSESTQLTGLELMQLNNEFGNFIGQAVLNFINENSINKNSIDCISSHGHTVFHQPEINLTTQIGNGANISAVSKLPVICDFRSIDLALNGQGAPLVPIGDALLFAEYDYCLNLGGIANISFEESGQRIAFDICPVNIVLNRLSTEVGKSYDENGTLAQSGIISEALLQKLNQLDYYNKSYPKSLGIEHIENEVFPILDSLDISPENKLRTFVEHIALQISTNLSSENKKILITGGGAFNTFLMDQIRFKTKNEIAKPSNQIINFKEALIFALLGVLRLRKESNCLASVTGSIQNNIGGCIYQAF